MNSKKILFFFPHNPYPPKTGAHQRCMEMLLALVQMGHKVVLASSALFSDSEWTDLSITALKKLGVQDVELYKPTKLDLLYTHNIKRIFHWWQALERAPRFWSLHWTPPNMCTWFSKLCLELGPDVIFMNYAYWDGLMRHSEWKRINRVIETHDLITLNQKMQSLLKQRLQDILEDRVGEEDPILSEDFFEKADLKACDSEFRIYDQYTHTIAISEQEKEEIENKTHHTRVLLIKMTKHPKMLQNSYSGWPIFSIGPNPFNLQGYIYLTRRILPRVVNQIPKFMLNVTGTFYFYKVPKCTSPAVRLCGFVDSLDPLYENAPFAVCPVFGGTGQQVKIVDAMSSGIPVIALKAAAKNSPIEHNINGFIANNADEFAEYVITLWKDRALCKKMGESAREKIASEFSREKLIEYLSQIIDHPV